MMQISRRHYELLDGKATNFTPSSYTNLFLLDPFRHFKAPRVRSAFHVENVADFRAGRQQDDMVLCDLDGVVDAEIDAVGNADLRQAKVDMWSFGGRKGLRRRDADDVLAVLERTMVSIVRSID